MKTNRMMRTILLLVLAMVPLGAIAQSDPHYTMFLYNKLLYNPGYAGSRDITSINANYRNQWSGIQGAPKVFNVTLDGACGDYMLPFRPVAVGGSLSGEKIGVESNITMMGYYAYRIKFDKSVLSFGLRAGLKAYSALYSQLSLASLYDQHFSHDVINALLPNAGSGIYWSGKDFYAGFAVPNMLQNYYDKLEKPNPKAKEVRGYYFSGGYVFHVNDNIMLEPQLLTRYAGNSKYRLPVNWDINLTAIFYDRFMAGLTYRTDKSLEFIVHVQATKNINIGYSYDYLLSDLRGYDKGSHEIVIGFDLVRDEAKYLMPRFIRPF